MTANERPFKRNYNLDVVRCLAMFMVVIWHFFWYAMRMSTIVADAVPEGMVGMTNYWLSQGLIVVCSACVNLFVLISGYFLAGRPFNWKRVILLWLEVFFYGMGIALLFYFIRPGSMTAGALAAYLFPVSRGDYWFFPKYMGLVCLAPFLSVIVGKLTRARYKCLLLVLGLLGCTFTKGFPFGEIMGASKGFSLIWFVFIFFFGGYFKRFPIRMSARLAFYACLGVSVAAIVLILVKTQLRHELLFEIPAYNSFGFLIALLLFIGFKKMKETENAWVKGLSRCSPYVFAVYLISDHPVLKQWLWGELVDWRPLINQWWFIPAMLGMVGLVFVLCVLIDCGRTWLFKAVGLERCAQWLGDKGSSAVKYICGESIRSSNGSS